jgi:hypothetical protein
MGFKLPKVKLSQYLFLIIITFACSNKDLDETDLRMIKLSERYIDFYLPIYEFSKNDSILDSFHEYSEEYENFVFQYCVIGTHGGCVRAGSERKPKEIVEPDIFFPDLIKGNREVSSKTILRRNDFELKRMDYIVSSDSGEYEIVSYIMTKIRVLSTEGVTSLMGDDVLLFNYIKSSNMQ